VNRQIRACRPCSVLCSRVRSPTHCERVECTNAHAPAPTRCRSRDAARGGTCYLSGGPFGVRSRWRSCVRAVRGGRCCPTSASERCRRRETRSVVRRSSTRGPKQPVVLSEETRWQRWPEGQLGRRGACLL